MTETYVREGREYSRVATNQAKATLVTKAATEQASAAQAQYAQRMEDLRLRIDPVYRASQQYKKSLRELIQFQRASDQPMEQYRKQVALLKEEFRKVSMGGRGARRSMSNLGIGIQQTGYQISDFAIQVQSGQSVLVAFSQQASQLVGVLPLVANDIGLSARAALGLSAGLGIAIPLVTTAANVLLNMGRESKEAEGEVDSLSDTMDRATSLFQRANKPVEDLTDTYGKFADEVKRAADFAARTALLELGDKVAEFNQNLREEGNLDGLIDRLNALRVAEEKLENAPEGSGQGFAQRVGVLQLQVSSLSEKMGLTVVQAENLNVALNAMTEASGPEAIAQSASDMLDFMRKVEEETGKVPPSFRPLIPLLEEAVRKGAALSGEIDGSTDAASSLTNQFDRAVDKINAMSSAIRNFYSELRSGGLNIQALEAQLSALQGGATRAEAKGEGLRKELMSTDLAREIMTSGSVGEQATFRMQVNQRVADSIRESQLSKQISEFGAGGSGGAGGGAGGGFDPQEYIAGLEQEARFKRTLVGLSDEQVKTEERRQSIVEKLTQDGENLTETESERVEKLLETEAQTRRLMEAEEQRQAMMDQVEGHMKNALMSVVDGSKSVEDAFRSMMRNILLAVYEQQVAQPAAEGIGNLISTGISSLFPSAKGNVFSGGDRVTAYADGGVVDRATMFPMRGGTGLMGEAGPEAIMPLKRGKGGKLGVASEGGGSLTVNVVMDPSTGALGAFVQDQAGQVVAKARYHFARETPLPPASRSSVSASRSSATPVNAGRQMSPYPLFAGILWLRGSPCLCHFEDSSVLSCWVIPTSRGRKGLRHRPQCRGRKAVRR